MTVGSTLLTRQRLVDRAAASDITLIAGPSGFGKTSLSTQMMERSQHGAVRVLVDVDATAASLAAQLSQSLAVAGHSDLAHALTAAHSDDALHSFVGAWAVRTEPLVVVFDEVQRGDTSAQAWMQALIGAVPDGQRLVLIGRRTPFVASDPSRTMRITTDDLRFTTAEIEEALADVGADASWAVEFSDRTGGWPAAVMLARDRLSRHPNVSPFIPTDDDAALLEHLVGQLLARRTPDEHARLQRLATVPRLSPAIADSLAGPGSFDLLLDSGLPLATPAPGWTELPDVVRAAIARDGTLDASTARAVARLYLDRSQFAAALGVMRAAGDLDGLADLFDERSWVELESYGLPQVRIAMTLLGDERLARRPGLLVKAAWVLEGRDPATRRGWLQLADQSTPVGDPMRALVDAELARDASRRGDVDTAEALARDAIDRCPPDELVPRAKALLAWGMANTIRCSAASLAIAAEQLTESATLFEMLGETRWETDALNRLGYAVLFHGGHCAEGEQQMRAALAKLPSASRERGSMLTYFADVLDHNGRLEEAAAAAREALDIGRRLGDQMVQGFAAWAMAWIVAHANDAEATHRWLAQTERFGGRWIEEANGVEFALAASEMMCLVGDEAAARAYAHQATERAERHSLQDALAPGLARLEATFGDAAAAEEILAGLDDSPWAVERSRWLRRLLRAHAAHRLGDTAKAARLTEEAFAEAAAIELPDLPLRQESRLTAALAPYRANAAETDAHRMRRLILLGDFALFDTTGDDITPPTGHPATLVKLLALRSTMTTDEVIDALWPDADLTTGRSRLRNLLNRVKSASGDIVVRTGDSLRLDAAVDVDIATFESLAGQALSADAAERPGLARLATAVYTGELLPGDRFEDWAAARRERFKRLFLALVDLLAADAEQRGELDEALRQLDLGIASEPMDEARYTRAAELLLHQGRRATAAEMVRRAHSVLDEIGVVPGRELQRLSDLLSR